ncbi:MULTISPECIES: hypothetical protein [Rhodococcus]|uniref:Luciferase domain-containing protein n=1 Tax=Rhodococcus cerastii TaxID=908616 RepID=A0ABU4D093_9NOCA|nr:MULTISPECIES: hypothetical protein [Rhodococcus]MDV6303135.1 hypothetical protein [Rhodococcus cerastii]MDV8054738.1 hypothetical protein [Rhodococcus sp. IEGM 1343]MDV8077113.1 hypothetical protein [Rhodococcus sp. IEGM 1370]
MHNVKSDYAAWMELGPGGLPANVGGWLITTALRPLARRDPLTVAGTSSPGLHWHLEQRPGTRPAIAPHPIPHRQLTDRGTHASIERLTAAVAEHAGPESPFHMERSRFERRGDALYVSDISAAAPWISRTKGEVLHVHESEGSMHVVMQPDDAQTVISAGWGELHPLAGRPVLGLPETYVFLYAPRDSDDIYGIEQIIGRAVSTARA